MSGKRIAGIISTIGAIVLGVYSWIVISNDMTPQGLFGTRYTYQAPLTQHEINMIMLCIIAGIALIVGIGLLLSDSQDN